MSYPELAALLRSRTDVTFGPGATENQITQAEEEIGPLVGEYRNFLSDFGWANVGHHEIFGLGAGTTRVNNLVETTLRERSYGRIPNLAPVENIGTGDLLCVRQLHGTLFESPVLLSPTNPDEGDYIEDRDGFAHWLIATILLL
jgi:hypothetical protein